MGGMTNEAGASPPPPGPARRLYLIRHGEAAPVARAGGAADPWQAVLTDRGRAQVVALADILPGWGLDLIVTSAVPRAIETGALLAARLGLVPGIEEGWNELRGGRVLAGSAEEIRRSVREAFRDAGQPGARFLGGERFDEFARRVGRALDRLLARPGWRRAAVVTHEPVIGYLLARCQGLGLDGLGRFQPGPGTASVLDWAAGADAAVVRLVGGAAAELRRLG